MLEIGMSGASGLENLYHPVDKRVQVGR